MSRLYNQAKSLFRPKIKTGSLKDRRKDFEEIVKSTDKAMDGVKFSPGAKAEIKKGVSTTLKKTSKLRDDIDKIKGTDKEYREAGCRIGYKKGTPNPFLRKSNKKKIEEAFKTPTPFMVKKDKKPKKRMMANKGGGADTGKMGEIKSKAALMSDKIKKFFNKMEPGGRMSDRDKENYKKLFKAAEKSPMQRQRVLDKLKSEAQKTGGNVMSADEMQKLKGESEKSFKDRMQKSFSAKKGGLAKKKKKFPDISGDGKVTMKDVLMARGVIPKNKKDKKKVI